ncbi:MULTISPECIES: maleate cis-trans isomerase family protein [Nocardiopsidaceae]|uniref:Maleate cis-trans isomerase n=1 Tax=Streptomonospora nanhaiensis TaxID=1323731 RepID=A0ABY6YMV4_9ACTN|nr:maleate cis-trans isomerase [Streptomonospora nanhaiensis]MEE2045528.1 maleate cis-trans isomerase [Nocardiopsis tropica]WAE73462.1 maleate cis-trans isomerase [Streptomonospora nanhaiensis]
MTRVGFLYPGFSAEDDYKAFEELLGGDVELPLVHTLMREDAHRVDALLDVGGEDVLAEGARELAAMEVDSAVWACTSGSFVFGWEGAGKQVEGVRRAAGVPSSSTSFAFVHALSQLRISRVAIAATYPDDVAQRFVEFLTEAGVTVLSLASHGIATAAEVGRLGPDDAVDFVISNDHTRADAVLVPDTALHSAHLIEPMEALLGKTVLTANQVSVWEGLRLAGADTVRPSGPGTLFRVGAGAVRSALPAR